jgi:hypothetical protein
MSWKIFSGAATLEDDLELSQLSLCLNMRPPKSIAVARGAPIAGS